MLDRQVGQILRSPRREMRRRLAAPERHLGYRGGAERFMATPESNPDRQVWSWGVGIRGRLHATVCPSLYNLEGQRGRETPWAVDSDLVGR